MNREFHFVKPKPAEKAILTNKKLVFQDKYDGISIEGFIDANSNIELFGRGVLKGKDSNFTKQFPELVNEIKIRKKINGYFIFILHSSSLAEFFHHFLHLLLAHHSAFRHIHSSS